MKFKKAAALTMAAAMTLGVTGGMPVSADDDIYEVVVQFPTLGTTPSDLQKVEEAINERTESEIGVHVTFYPVSAFETNNTTSLMVSSGEKLDLAISIFEGGVASYASGVLMDYGQGEDGIVNYFETQEFEDYCNTVRSWFENGYLSQDCNTTTDSSLVQMQTGNYLGMFSNAEPDMIANHSVNMQAYVGTDVVPLYTSAPASMTQFYQVTQWMIPITCDNPEKTMEFLNLTYKDKDIVNLLYRGIEGTHYNFVEGSDCVVEYPEGIDASNTPYSAVLNVWGDKMKDYVMAPLNETYYDAMKNFNSSITDDHISRALGYCFNSNSVKTQYAAVNDVITQYKAVLGMGVVDPASEMENFRSALKAAGIDDVIAENQKQYAEWEAAQQ